MSSNTYTQFKKKCELYKKKEEKTNLESKKIKRVLDNCKKEGIKYGHKPLTLLELIEIIKKEKKNHINDFLYLFPEIGIKSMKVSRQHVFEALWIIIFKLRLDDLFPSKGTRIFYNSIEKNAKKK
jgi:hypothetical protein